MPNTLNLVFAEGAANTLIFLYAYTMPYLQFMNPYDIGIEILRGMSGTLGVVRLAAPFLCCPGGSGCAVKQGSGVTRSVHSSESGGQTVPAVRHPAERSGLYAQSP